MSLEDKHALALGLRAFVLSSPYDVPDWLPPVLVALSGLASAPEPVKTTVRYTHPPIHPGFQVGNLVSAPVHI